MHPWAVYVGEGGSELRGTDDAGFGAFQVWKFSETAVIVHPSYTPEPCVPVHAENRWRIARRKFGILNPSFSTKVSTS